MHWLLDTRPIDGRPGLPRKRWELAVLALLLAAVIFVIDSFTSIESAVAVLYVLVLLLATEMLSRRGLPVVAVACAGLTVVSFLIGHGPEADAADSYALQRCAVSLAANLVTTAILLRDKRSREGLERANVALSRSERRYRSIFQQSRFSLWEQDFSSVRKMLAELKAEGVRDIAAYAQGHPDFLAHCARLTTILDANEAAVALLGMKSRAEVVGSLFRFLPAGDPGLLNALVAIFDGSTHVEGRGRLIAAGGREVTVLFGMTFPEDEQDFNRVVVALVDVTQREQAQETLRAAQAELARASRVATVGALSASIAHEINQPLAAVVMNAQSCLRWLRHDPPDVESAQRAAERAVQQGNRASQIVTQTRSKLISGAPEDEPVDLRRLAEEVALLLENELDTAAVSLRLDFAPQVPTVTASRTELQQVLVNLVSNGLDAMRGHDAPRREIAIRIDCPDESHVRVQVRDCGTGLGVENAGRMFQPFFTTKTTGMGMGLAICQASVERLGGQISARNHEGGGAVFEFVLPADSKGAA